MCTFKFSYTDGSMIKCEHIKSASYLSGGNRTNVSEQNLTTHVFQAVRDLFLSAENGSFSISHEGLRCIEVTTE